jgi:hypothetical protein
MRRMLDAADAEQWRVCEVEHLTVFQRTPIWPRQMPQSVGPTRVFNPFSSDVPASAGDDQGGWVSDSFGCLDANLDKVLDVETVRPLVTAVSERQQTVLMLRFFENMTQT